MSASRARNGGWQGTARTVCLKSSSCRHTRGRLGGVVGAGTGGSVHLSQPPQATARAHMG